MNKPKTLVKNVKRHWELYLLVLPVVLYFIIFKYAPMYGIQIAFRDFYPGMDMWKAKWVGFSNFSRLFRSFSFKNALRNTLTLSFLQLAIGFPLPIILAILLNEIRLAAPKKLLQTVSYAPHFISTVAMAGIILAFTASHGLIGQIYTALTGKTINMLTEPDKFKWIYVLSNAWKNAGWNSVIYIAALSSVDVSMYDAAKVDGASRLQNIWYLDLPSLLPTAVILLIMNCGQVLNVSYEQILMLQNDLNITASEVISTYSYQMGLINRDYSFSTAISLFNSVVNLTLLTSVNVIARKITGNSLW